MRWDEMWRVDFISKCLVNWMSKWNSTWMNEWINQWMIESVALKDFYLVENQSKHVNEKYRKRKKMPVEIEKEKKLINK